MSVHTCGASENVRVVLDICHIIDEILVLVCIHSQCFLPSFNQKYKVSKLQNL